MTRPHFTNRSFGSALEPAGSVPLRDGWPPAARAIRSGLDGPVCDPPVVIERRCSDEFRRLSDGRADVSRVPEHGTYCVVRRATYPHPNRSRLTRRGHRQRTALFSPHCYVAPSRTSRRPGPGGRDPTSNPVATRHGPGAVPMTAPALEPRVRGAAIDINAPENHIHGSDAHDEPRRRERSSRTAGGSTGRQLS
jgi:hypothetical protein